MFFKVFCNAAVVPARTICACVYATADSCHEFFSTAVGIAVDSLEEWSWPGVYFEYRIIYTNVVCFGYQLLRTLFIYLSVCCMRCT